jgi:hypothetical protein
MLADKNPPVGKLMARSTVLPPEEIQKLQQH